LNTSIYINGAEVFDKVAAAETDPARKKIYIDSLLLIHDLRIANCGEEAAVTNRKALMAVKYYANEAGKEAYVLDLMDKTFELNGNNVLDGTIIPYMQSTKINKLKLKALTDDQVFERYDRVQNIIDAKIKTAQSQGKPVDKYRTMREDVDKILITMVTVNCEFVRTKLGPKFKANPSDIGTAKKIFQFMLQDKCTDDPLWLQAAEAIHNDPNSPKDFGLAKNLAIRNLANENFPKAEQYFREALDLATEGKDKSEVLIYLGAIDAKTGNKPSARQKYRQALDADPSNKEAYEKIGDLYYSSFNECSKKDSYAEDRLVYIAAYEMYVRSGNAQKISQAKSQMPSVTELFEKGWNEGETKRVECWIGESVTLKTRGKE
jgi:tetratricopeptide (TPR) repeat protein